jgi:hypothetical protein
MSTTTKAQVKSTVKTGTKGQATAEALLEQVATLQAQLAAAQKAPAVKSERKAAEGWENMGLLDGNKVNNKVFTDCKVGMVAWRKKDGSKSGFFFELSSGEKTVKVAVYAKKDGKGVIATTSNPDWQVVFGKKNNDRTVSAI